MSLYETDVVLDHLGGHAVGEIVKRAAHRISDHCDNRLNGLGHVLAAHDDIGFAAPARVNTERGGRGLCGNAVRRSDLPRNSLGLFSIEDYPIALRHQGPNGRVQVATRPANR